MEMLEKLRQLGWTEYEARAYLALLQHNPATGYRIGKEAGVPIAKVYEALGRLVDRGAARQNSAEGGERARYAPVAPDEVMAGLRAQHDRLIDELSRDLRSLFLNPAESPSCEWLSGRAPVLGRANTLLAHARRSITLALPQGWDDVLQQGMEIARANQVRMDRVFSRSASILEATPGEQELLALVVDGTEALIAGLDRRSAEGVTEALTTRIPFLVRLCTDYVRLCRVVTFMPEAVTRLKRHDDWLDWEEAKQRRLLQAIT